MHRARGRRRLKRWQTWFNRAVSPVRGGVERIFGTLKRSYRADLRIKVMAYNLRRVDTLGARCRAAG